MDDKVIENKLQHTLHELLVELQLERARRVISMDASLEHDLGLGSLERAELFHRTEKNFNIKLPLKSLNEIKTLRDLIKPIIAAKPQLPFSPAEFKPILIKTTVNPKKCKTLIEVLELYAHDLPARPHIYLQDEQGNEEIITYGELSKRANLVAQGLVAHGIKTGETVAIMLPTCKDFFFAFMGILQIGAIPVPIYPPFRADQIEEYTKREAYILQNAEVRLLITFRKAKAISKILKTFIPSLQAVITVNSLVKMTGQLPSIDIGEEYPGLIQYTSGSTGEPKGVLLSHHNLLSNIKAYGQGSNVQLSDVVVSWLPLYHDMGLIGSWLGSFYYGLPFIIMSPMSFLTQPERWLWTIHYHRATISAAPNFAYEFCIRKIDNEDIEGLDLSCWRLAFNGAETIYPKTIENFTRKFKPYGFKPETMFPVYGLAESSVALTFPEIGRPPRIDKINRDIFMRQQKAVPAKWRKNYLRFVSCGRALPKHHVRVVDEQNQILSDRVVGELQFRGPSAMQGYYRNPDATRAAYRDGWWDTGDYAYIAEGELYITGRKKDAIIKAGRNLYPPKIEEVAGQVEGVRKGCVAAFGVNDPQRGTEKFIIVAEMRDNVQRKQARIRNEIIDNVVAVNGVPPDEVILVQPRTIPKTSSGKLRRSSCKEKYLAGKLSKPNPALWIQLVRLFIISRFKKLKQSLKFIGRLIYTGYTIILMALTILPVWLLIMALPTHCAGKLTRWGAKLLLFFAGDSIKLIGKENLTGQAVVFVSNHSSYLDSVVLLSVLPANIAFVGKAELLRTPIASTYVKKLKYLMVNRKEYLKSLEEVKQIKETLTNGRPILIYPEGTFAYATGLRPFKLGAFKIAAEQNISVCPIAIKGTRRMLRSGSKLARPGKVEVNILPCIQPYGTDMRAVSRLSKRVRKVIAEHCGEAPIDLIAAGLMVKKE